MGHPILPPGSEIEKRIDHLCCVAVTRELGPYWSRKDLFGRLDTRVDSHARRGVFSFTLYLDGKMILDETFSPSEVSRREGDV